MLNILIYSYSLYTYPCLQIKITIKILSPNTKKPDLKFKLHILLIDLHLSHISVNPTNHKQVKQYKIENKTIHINTNKTYKIRQIQSTIKIMKTNNYIKRYKPTHNIPVAAQLS